MSMRSSFFWDRFGCLREKDRVLGGEGEKAKMRGREGIVGVKTDLTRPYLYLGHLQLINYSIYLFLLFYKNKLYFIPYQMNK